MDAELGGDGDEAAADAHGDLGADDLGGGGGFGAVADHEADAEEVDAGAEGDVVFVVVGVFDEEGDADGGDGGGEGEGLGDVAGGGYGVGLHDLQVGGEVGVDGGVEDGEVEEADGAAGEDVAVCEEPEGEEGVRG